MPVLRSRKSIFLVVLGCVALSACTLSIHNPFSSASSSALGPELRTRQEATARGFKLVPGQDGRPPTIVDVQQMSASEWITWLEEHGIPSDPGSVDPSSSIWVLEFTDAALYQPCSAADQTVCVHDHVYLSLDEMSGKNLGFLFPRGGTPGDYVP